jgi:hypothetical protein
MCVPGANKLGNPFSPNRQDFNSLGNDGWVGVVRIGDCHRRLDVVG